MGFIRGFRAIKSLIFALIILALWGRSYFAGDSVRKGSQTQYVQVGSAWGSAIITFGHDGLQTRFDGRWSWTSNPEPREMLSEAGLGDSVWNRMGFGFHRRDYYGPGVRAVFNFIVPLWLMFLLTAPTFVRWVLRRRKAKLKTPDAPHAHDPGAMYACPGCGQLYARVPATCSICGQAMIQPHGA